AGGPRPVHRSAPHRYATSPRDGGGDRHGQAAPGVRDLPVTLRRRCLAVGERRSTPLASPPWGELSRAPRRRGRGRRPRRAPRWPMRAPEHDDPTPPDPEPDLEALRRYLLSASQACIRPPIDRFRHPWIA